MDKVINAINNAFRYKKNSFKIKKNKKTILFLKCLIKSNIIRYFKEVKDNVSGENLLVGYINPTNRFEIQLISKSGRRIYLGNKNVDTNEINCFYITTNSSEKKYVSSYDSKKKVFGELTAKIFI